MVGLKISINFRMYLLLELLYAHIAAIFELYTR